MGTESTPVLISCFLVSSNFSRRSVSEKSSDVRLRLKFFLREVEILFLFELIMRETYKFYVFYFEGGGPNYVCSLNLNNL